MYPYFYCNIGGDHGGISSPSLALQFLSNHLPPPPHSLMTSSPLSHHINSNGHYSIANIPSPLLYGFASTPNGSHVEHLGADLKPITDVSVTPVTKSLKSITNHASLAQSPEHKHQIVKHHQTPSSSPPTTKLSPEIEEPASSSSQQHSPLLISSNEQNSGAMSHVPPSPYGLS